MEMQCYTDGSSFNEGEYKGLKAGAWAYKIIINEDKNYVDYGTKISWNNTLLEMEAIKQLLLKLNEFRQDIKNIQITIYSDCKSTVNAINKLINHEDINVKFKNVFNDILNLVNTLGLNITFKWIKGHSKIIHNDEVDSLARENARTLAEELKQLYFKTNGCLKEIIDTNDVHEILTKKPLDTEDYIRFKKISIPYCMSISKPKENKIISKFNKFDENNGIEKAIEVKKRGNKYVLVDGYINYLWLMEKKEYWIPIKIVKNKQKEVENL